MQVCKFFSVSDRTVLCADASLVDLKRKMVSLEPYCTVLPDFLLSSARKPPRIVRLHECNLVC